ncbi:uncharacterized protein G2W53_042899 [Senna tora]|uniref:Uncharacterized protein n=1 Tax=Senna tora TaxID=362788 RepID=A0A834SJX1_9FABA|nr:uncharacterized protein G2W53_042899 [Senna tora]
MYTTTYLTGTELNREKATTGHERREIASTAARRCQPPLAVGPPKPPVTVTCEAAIQRERELREGEIGLGFERNERGTEKMREMRLSGR